MSEIEKAIEHYKNTLIEIKQHERSFDAETAPRVELILSALRSQLTREQNEPCEWQQEDEDGSHYSSSCGYELEFNEDGPNSNDFVYCPKCGKPINEIQWWVG